jgi:hypothetical protein
MFDPAARDTVSGAEASLAVWFDAFTMNVDRTPRNANLLVWHRKLYLIDHGAALYFHHDWAKMEEKTASPFSPIAQHVLLPWAREIEQAAAIAHGRLSEPVFAEIVALAPDEWLDTIPGSQSPNEKRAAYVDFFLRRLKAAKIFEEEAMEAYARLV